jgi:hypothetical protein
MLDAFHRGGWGMVPTLVFGVLMVLASLQYAARPERRLVPLLVSLGLITVVSGGLGTVTGMIRCLCAMEEVKPDERWIWMLGLGESLNVIGLALGMVALGLIATSVGALRIARRPQPA